MGSRISEAQLHRSVLSYIHKNQKEIVSEGAGAGRDYAAVSLSRLGDVDEILTASATVSYAVGEDFEQAILAVQKACNNIYAGGGIPKLCSVMMTFPEGTKEPRFKNVMRLLGDYCDTQEIQIIGGETLISDALMRPIYSVTLFGTRMKDTLATKKKWTGSSLIVTKTVGMEAAWVLGKQHKEELLKRYASDYILRADTFSKSFSVRDEVMTILNRCAQGDEKPSIFMHDISGGGIFAALWEIGERLNAGMEVKLLDIPLDQVTVEISNFLDYNPYMSASAGAMLIATDEPECVLDWLYEAGVDATVIGELTDDKNKVIVNGEETRFLVPPKNDSMYEI